MSLTDTQKAALRDHRSPEALIAFLTIRHPSLTAPLRLVRNTVDMVKGGQTFAAAMFDYAVISDADRRPMAEIRIPNVDRRIGASVRQLNDRGNVQIEICSSADFDESVDPHTEIGAAANIYSFAEFEIMSVTVTASDVTARVGLRDYSQEPWPYLRATQNRFPGLFA